MSSPNITFQTIPSNLRVPGAYTELNTNNALQGLSPENDNIVILAQMTSQGIATPLTPIPIFDAGTAQLQFGAGSVAHLTAQSAIAANPNAMISVMPISDAIGSSPATGTLVIGDTTASTNGQLSLYVGDQLVQYSYSQNDTKASISAGVMTALASVAQQLPVTDSSSAGTITFTAKNKGTVGNFIGINASVTQGLASVTTTDMAGGATDPAIGPYTTTGTPLNLIQGAGYTIVVNTIPSATSLGQGVAFNTFVSSSTEQRPCVQVSAVTDLVGTQASAVALASGMNDGRSSIAYLAYTSNTPIAQSPAFKIAGAYGAVLASQADPAVPYDNLVLAGIAAPAVIDRLSRTNEEYLLNNGITPLHIIPGEDVAIVRAISTYTLNGSSIPDPTLLDINTIREMDYCRTQFNTRFSNVFARAKLTPRITASVKDQAIDVMYLLQSAGILQNVDTLKSGVIVQQDLSNVNQLDVKIPLNIVSGLHIIATQLNLILGSN